MTNLERLSAMTSSVSVGRCEISKVVLLELVSDRYMTLGRGYSIVPRAGGASHS
jgi:hypothetical protein